MSPHDGGDPPARLSLAGPSSPGTNSRRPPSLSTPTGTLAKPNGRVRVDSQPSPTTPTTPGGTARYASRRLSFHKRSRRTDSLDDHPSSKPSSPTKPQMPSVQDEESSSSSESGSEGSTTGTESDDEDTDDPDGVPMPKPVEPEDERPAERSEALFALTDAEQKDEVIPSIDSLRLRHRRTAPIRYLIDKDAPPFSRLSHRLRAPFQVAVSSTPEIVKLQEEERKLMGKERAWLVRTMVRGGVGGQAEEDEQWEVALADHIEGRKSKHGQRRRKRDVVVQLGPVQWARERYEDLLEVRPDGFLAPHAETFFEAAIDTAPAVDLEVKGQLLPDRLLRVRGTAPGRAWELASGTMKKLTLARKNGANLNAVMAKYRKAASGHERQDTTDSALGLWLNNQSRADSLDLGAALSRGSTVDETGATNAPYIMSALSALASDSTTSLDDDLTFPSNDNSDPNLAIRPRQAQPARVPKGKSKAADNVDVPAVILEGCEIGHDSPEEDEELASRPVSQIGTPMNRSRLSLIATAPPSHMPSRAPSPASYFDEDVVKSPDDVPDLRLEGAPSDEDDRGDRMRHFIFPPPRARTPSPATGAPEHSPGLGPLSSSSSRSPAHSPSLSLGGLSPPHSPSRKSGSTLAPPSPERARFSPSREAPTRPLPPQRAATGPGPERGFTGPSGFTFPRQISNVSNASTATFGQYTRPQLLMSPLTDYGSGASTPDRGDLGSPLTASTPTSRFARFADQSVITLDHSPERDNKHTRFLSKKGSQSKRRTGGSRGSSGHSGNGEADPKTSAGIHHHVGRSVKRGATTMADRLPNALTRKLRLSQHATEVMKQAQEEAAAAAELADMLAEVAIEDEGKGDVRETDILFQSQGGLVLFGRAYFTSRLASGSWQTIKVIKHRMGSTWDSQYAPGEGKPKRVHTKYNITSFPLPTDDWEWITDWAADMRGDVDADGWQYFDCLTGRWRADRMSARNYVRRRAFIRTRSKQPLDLGGKRRNDPKREINRWIAEEDAEEEEEVLEKRPCDRWAGECPAQTPRMGSTLDGLSQATRILPYPRHVLLGLDVDLDPRDPFFPMRKINEEWEATRKAREAIQAQEGRANLDKAEEETLKRDALAEVNLHRVSRALRDVMTDREKLKFWRHYLNLPPSSSARASEDTSQWPLPEIEDVWHLVVRHIDEVTRLFLFARSRRDFTVLLCHHLHKHHEIHRHHYRGDQPLPMSDLPCPVGDAGRASPPSIHVYEPDSSPKTTPQVTAGLSLLAYRNLLPFWSQIIPLLVRYSFPADSSTVTKEAIELRKILDHLEARKKRPGMGHHHHRAGSTTTNNRDKSQSAVESDLAGMSDLFPRRNPLKRDDSTATTIDTIHTTTHRSRFPQSYHPSHGSR